MDLRSQIFAMQSVYAPLFIEPGKAKVMDLQRNISLKFKTNYEGSPQALGDIENVRIVNLPNIYEQVPVNSYFQFMRLMVTLPDYRFVKIHTEAENLSEPVITVAPDPADITKNIIEPTTTPVNTNQYKLINGNDEIIAKLMSGDSINVTAAADQQQQQQQQMDIDSSTSQVSESSLSSPSGNGMNTDNLLSTMVQNL